MDPVRLILITSIVFRTWSEIWFNLFKRPFFKTFLDIRSPLQPACIENPYFSQYLHWNTTLNTRSVLFHELTSVIFEPVLSAISLSLLPFRLVGNIDKDAIQALKKTKNRNISLWLGLNNFKIRFCHFSIFFTPLESNTHLNDTYLGYHSRYHSRLSSFL